MSNFNLFNLQTINYQQGAIMTTNTKNNLTFTVFLGQKAHQLAQNLIKSQKNKAIIKQIYLNTLAVYAVNWYLECLGIETDLENSDHLNIITQSFLNVANLTIKNYGKIECRYILPDQDFCEIPPEVWSERIGYVGVQLNQELTEATLIGFIDKINEQENLPLDQFQPLDNLIKKVTVKMPPLIHINVKDWLKNISNILANNNVITDLKQTWLNLEQLDQSLNINTPVYGRNALNNLATISDLINILKTDHRKQSRLSSADLLGEKALNNSQAIAALTEIINQEKDQELRRQASVSLGKIAPDHPQAGVKMARIVDLGISLRDYALILIVTVMPDLNHKTQIHFQLKNAQPNSCLPPNLLLKILDENETILHEEQTKNNYNYLQRGLRCDDEDLLMIEISLGDAIFTETFIV